MTTRPWHRPDYQRYAVFDATLRHRYTLTRTWGTNPDPFVVIGLNPSTADASQDDPTIRRCIDFADQMGFGEYVMLNAHSFRATDPKVMRANYDPADDAANDAWIWAELTRVPWAVCAWSDLVTPERTKAILGLFAQARCEPRVFGLTKRGNPRHALYLPRTARPVKWEVSL